MIKDIGAERERLNALEEFLANGGREEDFAFDYRQHQDGSYWVMVDDLSRYREMTTEEIEDELEELQDDLDEIIELIEEWEDTYSDIDDLDDDIVAEYEELLDEQFCVDVYIRRAMQFLEL